MVHTHGKYTSSCGEAVEKNLQRVQLDFERGKVSLYNAVDITHVYTSVDTFVEKLHPFFLVEAADAEAVGIKICERNFSVVFQRSGKL